MLRQLGLLGSPGALLGPESNLYWLGEPGLAMGSVIAVHVWRLTPLAAVIMMAGLVAIPRTWRRRPGWTAPATGGGCSR